MMENNIRLSFILPCYGVEKYIAECLDSLYNQDISESEYEVICVNDCSPDGMRDIIVEYQKQHKNLVLIDHEVNKKQGGARNTGLKAARGKYIWFVDSDDYIEKNVLNRLLAITEKNNLEILLLNPKSVSKESVCHLQDVIIKIKMETEVMTGVDFFNCRYVDFWVNVVPFLRIYSKEFLIKYNLFFVEGAVFEDVPHSLQAMLLSTRFKYYTGVFYYYRVREGSTIRSYMGGEKIADKIACYFQCLEISEGYKSELVGWEWSFKCGYVQQIAGTSKSILYLPIKEKYLFCSKIKLINRKILIKYQKEFSLSIYLSIYYPFIMLILSIPFSVLRPLRSLKRKIFNKK